HGQAAVAPNDTPPGFSPAQIQEAYDFSKIFFQHGRVRGTGAGETIAIVDAFDNPTVANDLGVFDQQFSLAAGHLIKVGLDAQGKPSTTSFPPPNQNWAGEIDLDVEWAHAVAPQARILLVEANSNSIADLLRAVDYARHYQGVTVVSMSWDAREFAGEGKY